MHEDNIQLNVAQNREQVMENFFPTDRGIRRRTKQLPSKYAISYLTVFHSHFIDDLRMLRAEDVWVNVGGGELFAETERLTLDDFANSEKPTMCAVMVKSPDTEDFRENYKFLKGLLDEKFIFMQGRRIEDIPLAELPKAKLVSDLYGATAFSEHIDVTLQRELDILRLGGMLYTTLDKIFIQDKAGKRVGKKRYIQSIKGTEIIYFGGYFSTLVIKKTSEQVTVPPLELVSFLSYRNVRNPKELEIKMLNCERHYSILSTLL